MCCCCCCSRTHDLAWFFATSCSVEFQEVRQHFPDLPRVSVCRVPRHAFRYLSLSGQRAGGRAGERAGGASADVDARPRRGEGTLFSLIFLLFFSSSTRHILRARFPVFDVTLGQFSRVSAYVAPHTRTHEPCGMLYFEVPIVVPGRIYFVPTLTGCFWRLHSDFFRFFLGGNVFRPMRLSCSICTLSSSPRPAARRSAPRTGQCTITSTSFWTFSRIAPCPC